MGDNKNGLWKYSFLILLLVVVIMLFVKSEGVSTKDSNDSVANSQKVVISYKDYNYYPQIIRVKLNEPVSISLDKSVQGCFREFVIPQFGVDKYLASPSDLVTFTPDRQGSFVFRCGMGMGSGTLIVE